MGISMVMGMCVCSGKKMVTEKERSYEWLSKFYNQTESSLSGNGETQGIYTNCIIEKKKNKKIKGNEQNYLLESIPEDKNSKKLLL